MALQRRLPQAAVCSGSLQANVTHGRFGSAAQPALMLMEAHVVSICTYTWSMGSADPHLSTLCHVQAILFCGNKAIGRLLAPELCTELHTSAAAAWRLSEAAGAYTAEPSVPESACRSPEEQSGPGHSGAGADAPLQVVKLAFSRWQPAGSLAAPGRAADSMHIAVNEAFRASEYRLQVSTRRPS